MCMESCESVGGITPHAYFARRDTSHPTGSTAAGTK